MTRPSRRALASACLLLAAGCGGPSTQAKPIGSPCATAADCGTGAFFCATQGHPGGYCKRDCAADADCPAEAVCVRSGAAGSCHKRCATSADCRAGEGYVCVDPHKADGDGAKPYCDAEESKVFPQTLFVAHEGTLASYDLVTGMERAGTVTNVTGPVDLQALADGHLLVDLTGRNEVLVVDGRTMLEVGRVKSSGGAGTRPVHDFVSPTRNGRTLWFSLNDGTAGMPATNSARILDVTPGSATYLQAIGEFPLGIGHHKAAFSSKKDRIVVSNISDCDNVLTVYDYGDPKAVKALATLTAKQAGWDGLSFPRTCDPTFQMGVPPAPHGCATSKASGKTYCNLTGAGDIVVVDIDADPPTFASRATAGAGGGYTKASPDGKYLYSLQESPREGDMRRPGAKCQIGQVAVIDAGSDTVVKELPILYKGPGCADSLAGTDEATANLSHSRLSPDGKTLFVTVGGGFMNAAARTRQLVAVDVSTPAMPVQLPSIPVGTGTGHVGDALSGDGKWLFVVHAVDGSVSQIDVATRSVTRTIKTQPTPLTVATFGSAEGPGEQTGPIH